MYAAFSAFIWNNFYGKHLQTYTGIDIYDILFKMFICKSIRLIGLAD